MNWMQRTLLILTFCTLLPMLVQAQSQPQPYWVWDRNSSTLQYKGVPWIKRSTDGGWDLLGNVLRNAIITNAYILVELDPK